MNGHKFNIQISTALLLCKKLIYTIEKQDKTFENKPWNTTENLQKLPGLLNEQARSTDKTWTLKYQSHFYIVTTNMWKWNLKQCHFTIASKKF